MLGTGLAALDAGGLWLAPEATKEETEMVEEIVWAGPFRLRQLLDRVPEAGDDGCPRPGAMTPPEGASVYIVTASRWQGKPSPESTLLYVGGTPHNPKRFRVRIGEFVSDSCGFFEPIGKGHHSGAQSVY